MTTNGNLQETLIVLGAGCVIAAIAGGGIEITDKIKFPRIISIKRQLLLGGFGVLLWLVYSGLLASVLRSVNPGSSNLFDVLTGVGFLLLWTAWVVANLVAWTLQEQRFKSLLIESRNDTSVLLKAGETAFWKQSYDWAARFIEQARTAAPGDEWQSAYAILLGAQLALALKADTWGKPIFGHPPAESPREIANNTRAELINAMQVAAREKTGYLSDPGHLRKLAGDLTAMRPQLAPKGMVERFRKPVLSEIDLVLTSIQQALKTEH
jgi:hypothetical protein